MSAKVLEIDKEIEEAVNRVSSGDPDELKAAREKADRIRKEMRAKYGKGNIAVELVQDARNGE